MTVILVGANYRDLPLHELEQLEKNAESIRDRVIGEQANLRGIDGGVLVSTCNRFEIYLDVDDASAVTPLVVQEISEVAGLDRQYCESKFQFLSGPDAYRHLFEVSSGLDSMVVGEAEIAGQIKRALSETQELGLTSRITESLFQRAASVSKRVTSETGLGAAGRSLISSALDLLGQRGFPVEGKSVLVIGTGAYARVVIAALDRSQVGSIAVYSPSGRAELFSETHPTTPVSEQDFLTTLNSVDFIVACSGTHGTILESSHLSPRNAKLPIVDLSLSPDVAHDVRNLEFVDLIDLAEIHKNAPVEHQETIDQARSIIDAAVDEFQKDLASRVNDPLVKALRAHVGEIVQKEVDRVRRKSGDEVAAQVERSLALVTKTIFHKPTIHAKSSAVSGDTDEYQKAIEVLFGFSVDAEAEDE